MHSQIDVAADDVSLRLLWDIVWRSRLLIIGATLAGLAVAGIAVVLAPRQYEAITVLGPVSTQSSGTQLGGMGGLASQFSGLASLAGVTVPGDTEKWESFAYLDSLALVREYVNANSLLPVLQENARDMVQLPWDDEPATLWEVTQQFRDESLHVSRDARSGLVTLSVIWTDPKLAAEWANGIVQMGNERLRGRAIAQAERNVAYLKEQASKTESVELRQAMYTITLGEIRSAMLARGNAQYAFKVIDPAVMPEEPFSPRPVMWLLLGTMGGALASAAVVLGRAALMRR